EPQLTVSRPIERSNPASWQRVAVERIQWDAAPAKAVDKECCIEVFIKGRAHEVVLRTPLQQQMDLRTTADWLIRPRLLQVPGIAEVLVMGGERKQYQVLLDPAALLDHDVTLMQVEQAIKDNNLNASGGFTMEGQQERPIRVI